MVVAGGGVIITSSVRENVCNNSKNVKSHVFWILKKKRKSVRIVSQVILITQSLITQLPEVSTDKSQSPTSDILLRSADTRNYNIVICSSSQLLFLQWHYSSSSNGSSTTVAINITVILSQYITN